MSYYGNRNIPRKHGMGREDEVEMNIYCNVDPIKSSDVRTETENSNIKSRQTPQYTGSDTVRNRSSRAAQVCLVLLCVLLLTAVIVLSVLIYTKSKNYTEETRRLLTNLTEERDQLNKEKHELSKSLQEKDGWIYYKSSLYLFSCEKKSWIESRKYCTERGADLIIINNREEQGFVKKKSAGVQVWIGLTDRDVEGTWRWVDGSTVTSGFWAPGEPNSYRGRDKDCAVNFMQGWADYPCSHAFQWICEKVDT